MKYLAISSNTGDMSDLVDAEFARVDELRATGTVRNGWLRTDTPGAVLVLECADRDEALAALGTLPSVTNDATVFTIIDIVDLDLARSGLG